MVPALCFALAALAVGTDFPKASPWLTDYAAARTLARQNGKPLFVVFRCPQ